MINLMPIQKYSYKCTIHTRSHYVSVRSFTLQSHRMLEYRIHSLQLSPTFLISDPSPTFPNSTGRKDLRFASVSNKTRLFLSSMTGGLRVISLRTIKKMVRKTGCEN